jgi:hypothetical protein
MDGQSLQPITMSLSKVTLAAGTTTTLSTTGTTTYCIRSKAYTFSAWTNQATPTLDYATGLAFIPVLPNQGSIFLIGVDAAGTMRVIQGTVVALDNTGAFINAPTFGGLSPAGSITSTTGNFCPVGYLVIKAGSTAAAGGWLFGTNNMSSVTGITYTFQDCVGEPDRPQIA